MLNLPGLDIDIQAEIARYKEYAEKIRPLVVDSVAWLTGTLIFPKRSRPVFIQPDK
jgi:hypothetical protein